MAGCALWHTLVGYLKPNPVMLPNHLIMQMSSSLFKNNVVKAHSFA